MEEYIWRWQNTAAQYNALRSLLDLFEGPESEMGARVRIRWWYQEGKNMAGEREAELAEAEAEEDGVEERQRGRKGILPEWSTGKE